MHPLARDKGGVWEAELSSEAFVSLLTSIVRNKTLGSAT